MALHSFDPEIAERVGVNAATIYQNIVYWIEKNEANDKHCYDGQYWTYNSVKAFGDQFPYLSAKQIKTAINKLIEQGLIVKGDYNKANFDKTCWYGLAQKGQSISPKGPMEVPKRANGSAPEGQPIPDSKPNIKPDISEKPLKERDQYNKPDQPTFKRFMTEIWSHRWKNGDDRKTVYFAYLKLDAAQREHCAAVIEQAKRDFTSQYENQFRKGMAVWLNANGWEKYEQQKPDQSQIDWAAWMDAWHTNRTWHPSLGPEPGYAGCRVPKRFFQEQGAAA